MVNSVPHNRTVVRPFHIKRIIWLRHKGTKFLTAINITRRQRLTLHLFRLVRTTARQYLTRLINRNNHLRCQRKRTDLTIRVQHLRNRYRLPIDNNNINRVNRRRLMNDQLLHLLMKNRRVHHHRQKAVKRYHPFFSNNYRINNVKTIRLKYRQRP